MAAWRRGGVAMAAVTALLPASTAWAQPGPREVQIAPREVLIFPHEPAMAGEIAARMKQEGMLILGIGRRSGMILAAVPIEGFEWTYCEYFRMWEEVRAAEPNLCGEALGGRQPDCPYDSPPGQISCMIPQIDHYPFPPLQATRHSISYPSGMPNDEAFCYQWGLKNVGQTVVDRTCSESGGMTSTCWEMAGTAGIDLRVIEAWEEFTTGSEEVTIAVIDTGTEYCNPDFESARFFSPDLAFTCIGNDGTTYPCCCQDPCIYGLARDNDGHGTIVASVIAATVNNSIGIAGLDQECKLLSVRAMARSDSTFGPQLGRFLLALEEILENDAYESVRVVNLSYAFSCETSCSSFSTQIAALETLAADYRADNRFIVCGAGNGTDADQTYPQRLEDVITVGGIDPRGWRFDSPSPCHSSFESSTGESLDFMAQGTGHVALICQSNPGLPAACSYTTYPCLSDFGENFLTGTSFAAPQVCAAISLILAYAIELDIVDPSNN